MSEPRIEIVTVPSIFAEVEAKLRARQEKLTPAGREMVERIDRELAEADFRRYVLGEE